ncbi:MAG: cadherin-like beta sandwich domain-containing protein, partial [Erysipelotrichaceae bacterium]|nr:cadherin-like beta sandwich domain-containing protein [Erysipelotrichaceae bacterium]
MKRLFKVALLALCVVMSCFNSIDRIQATSGSTSLWASSSSVTVGNSVSVTLSVSADSPIIAKMQVYYNSGYLQYSSCSSGDYNPNTGYVVFDTYPNSSGSLTITFNTIGVGTTTVSASVIEFIDYDGASVSGYSGSLSTSITINQAGGGGEGGGGGGGYTPVTPTKSRDATLSDITIDGFEIEPGFSSDVYDYKVYVPRGTESLDISADKSNSKASVSSIDGSVEPGWNEINIKVTAEDDDYTRTYTLNVYVDEEPTVFYTLNDQQLGVVKNLDKVAIYPEHEARDLEIEGNKLTVFNWKAYDVIYLEDSEQNRDFYLYSEHDNTVIGK